MQEAVRRYSDELRCAQGVEAQIRVGVNSGDVVVRTIGSDLRMDYIHRRRSNHALSGPHGAARNSRQYPSDCWDFAAGRGPHEVTALGPVPVKGRGEPIKVFELAPAPPAPVSRSRHDTDSPVMSAAESRWRSSGRRRPGESQPPPGGENRAQCTWRVRVGSLYRSAQERHRPHDQRTPTEWSLHVVQQKIDEEPWIPEHRELTGELARGVRNAT